MKVCALTPLKNPAGTQLAHPDGAKATFRSVMLELCCVRMAGDPSEIAYSVNLYRLAAMIFGSEFVELTDADIALVRDRVARAGYSHALVGAMAGVLGGT